MCVCVCVGVCVRERERLRSPYHIFKNKSEVGCGVYDVMKSDNVGMFQSFQ